MQDDKNKKKADSLDNSAKAKRDIADNWEKTGLGQKKIKFDGIKSLPRLPNGRERIDMATKLRRQAEIDEYKAKLLRNKK